MSVRDNLPTGSSRNKIEYLAECIEQSGASNSTKINELTVRVESVENVTQNLSSAPFNLLVNPDFSHSTFDMSAAATTAPKWARAIFTYENQSSNHINLGQSYGRPAPYGWGIELNADGTDYHSLNYLYTGSVVERQQYRAKAALEIVGGFNTRYLHFSVFTAPYVTPTQMDWHDEVVRYSAYFRGVKRTGQRFGVLEIDRNGDFVAIVAQAPVPTEPHTMDFQQAWIHNISLEPGRLYAYFVESEAGTFACVPLEAGVFANNAGVDVVPDLTPRITEHTRMIESFGTYTKAEIAAGVTLNVGRYPMPFGMEKHLIMSPCRGADGTENPYNRIPITKVDYQSVLVKGDTTSDDTRHIMAYYSPYPVHLNYFNSPNYVAP